MLIKKILLFLPLMLLASCSQVAFPCICGCNGSKYISVLNEPINQERLASVHVNAPDPLHEINPHGQRLYINWRLPAKYKEKELKGILYVHYNVSEQATIPFKIDHTRGMMVYEITNEEYFKKQGILSYKVQIFSEGQEVDVFQHALWTELITLETF